MSTGDSVSQLNALRRIRALSWPLMAMISLALGALLITAILEIVLLLGFPRFLALPGVPRLGSLHTYVNFGEWGVGVVVGEIDLHRLPGFILVDGFTNGQRFLVTGLVAACWTCSVLALVQLRGLFALYSRGVVFASGNITRMKKFGVWLVVTPIVVNVSGRLFVRVPNAPLEGIANTIVAVMLGAMIYVIGYVMQLAREADLERKEFV